MMKMTTRRRRPLVLALLVAGAASGARAADDAFEFFSEEAKVTTASRRLEPVSEAPVAVEIVTADDIRESGAVNIWDLLRYRAGMDVIDGRSGEGNRALVSIRGFPAEFVNSLLVLVDGRSVFTGLSGGAVWQELPVQIQDIERIEIIRGPNAALYGSNAGLGVINIITRRPVPERTVSGGAQGGNQGLHREQAAFEDGGAAGAYRLSYTHKEEQGFPTTRGTAGQDYLFSNKGNFRGYWKPTEDSTVELLSGGGWDDVGVIDGGNPSGRFRNHFEMLKHSCDFSPESSVEAMVSRREDVRTYDETAGGLLTVREIQYDAEAQHRLDWMDGALHTVYGGNFRYTGVDSTQLFMNHPYQKNAMQRGFASQSWQVLPRLNLVGAASVEHTDTGGVEPAYQFAAVSRPWDSHVFRASYALAPTIPTIYNKAADQRASSSVLLIGNPSMVPQRLRSYEVSYQGSDGRRMQWETNLFYMTVDRLSETVVQSVAGPLTTLTFDSGDDAIARGAEVKWSYRWSPRRSVYANYTYETISDAKGQTNVRKGTPPHKANLGGTTDLTRGFSLTLNAGYQDAHTLNSQATGQTLDIPEYWRADGRLAFSPARGWELFVACQNMLQARHVEFADGLVVPRTYQAGVTARFGP
ncbi:MAG TPA: TonB-dependent receptor [Elusimicrobiota bacterium]|nr:TonB-dependent receptor [Elusimicrobiota bacterium]